MAQYETMKTVGGVRAAAIDEGLRAHMNKVYGTMSVGMLITAVAAWAIAGLAVTSDPTNATYALRDGQYLTGLGVALYASPLRWVIFFAPLAFILFGWGALLQRGSAAAVQLGFFAFAAVIGVSFSSIFLVYTPYSITQTFLVTAIAFAGLSLYGYVTKKDLAPMRTFLIMGVIGLLAAIIVNLFLQSDAMMFAIASTGIVLFAGLTAAYTQQIKNTYVEHAAAADQEWMDKAAFDGALSLYISFLNMFQFLLYFMGQE